MSIPDERLHRTVKGPLLPMHPDRRTSEPEEEWDRRSVEAVEWGLFAVLLCWCDKCRSIKELPEWSEPPWDGDVSAWAKEQAPKVQAEGWSLADDGFNLLCPSCQPGQDA